MKKIGFIAVAALLATPAFAQVPQTLAPSSNPDGLPTESNSDQGMFVQGIGRADFTASFDTIDTATSVTIVRVADLPSTTSKSLLDGFAARPDDVAALHPAIQRNQFAMSALEAAGFTLDDIVGVEASEEGVVTLYVQG